MRDQKTRFDLSLGKDNVVVTDTSTGESTIWSRGHFTSYHIGHKIIDQHLGELQQELVNSTKRNKVVLLRYINPESDIMIQEIVDGKWQIMANGVIVTLENGVLYPANAINVNSLLTKISRCRSIIATAEAVLTPEIDTVRIISDIGILAWKYMEHSMTHLVNDYNNGKIRHVFADGVYHADCTVEIGDETTKLCDASGRAIFEIPTDGSIRFFYAESCKREG